RHTRAARAAILLRRKLIRDTACSNSLLSNPLLAAAEFIERRRQSRLRNKQFVPAPFQKPTCRVDQGSARLLQLAARDATRRGGPTLHDPARGHFGQLCTVLGHILLLRCSIRTNRSPYSSMAERAWRI